MQLVEVSKDTLTDRVIRAIKTLIWRGDVMAGEYLPPQAELATQLGVSLSTLREAVKALSIIGLLDARPGRGTLVLPDAREILSNETAMCASLGHVEFEQVLEALRVLEVALTRMAAERATPEDVVQVAQCLDEMRSAAAPYSGQWSGICPSRCSLPPRCGVREQKRGAGAELLLHVLVLRWAGFHFRGTGRIQHRSPGAESVSGRGEALGWTGFLPERLRR